MDLDIRRWTLRAKVIFHVLVLAAVSAGILIVLSLISQHRLVHELFEREVELVGSLTKSSVFFLKKLHLGPLTLDFGPWTSDKRTVSHVWHRRVHMR